MTRKRRKRISERQNDAEQSQAKQRQRSSTDRNKIRDMKNNLRHKTTAERQKTSERLFRKKRPKTTTDTQNDHKEMLKHSQKEAKQ